MKFRKIEYPFENWLNYVAAYKDHKIYMLSARNNTKTRLVCLFRKLQFEKDGSKLYGQYFDLNAQVGLIDDGYGIEMVRHAIVWAIKVIDKTPERKVNIPDMSGLAKHNMMNRKVYKGTKFDETIRLLDFLNYLGKTDRNRWAVSSLDAVEIKKRT